MGKISGVAVIGDRQTEVNWDDGHIANIDVSDVIAAHITTCVPMLLVPMKNAQTTVMHAPTPRTHQRSRGISDSLCSSRSRRCCETASRSSSACV